jgi:predicted MPP superfamily phosphohydrolase
MKIRIHNVRQRNHHIYCIPLFFVPFFLLVNFPAGFSQVIRNQQRIYFISDVQAPMSVEKIISKPYRNEEARDSLFADIIRQHPKNLFMLGDLTSKGSKEKAWVPLDTFLNSLKKINTSVYAIPGNHEYMGKSAGLRKFKLRFPEQWLCGYFVTLDSIAIVMLNSNFNDLSKNELSKQLTRYKSVMDSLDTDPHINTIIVCTHHAPYSNSKIVGSSKPVADLIVPIFEKSQKSKLFISGHSHNLEYFSNSIGKHFLVIGGGGGIAQPLIPMDKRKHEDLLNQDAKPLYFYLVIEKNGNCLRLIAKGFKKDFSFFESDIGIVPVN